MPGHHYIQYQQIVYAELGVFPRPEAVVHGLYVKALLSSSVLSESASSFSSSTINIFMAYTSFSSTVYYNANLKGS